MTRLPIPLDLPEYLASIGCEARLIPTDVGYIPLKFHCFARDLDGYYPYEGSADTEEAAIQIARDLLSDFADIYQTAPDGSLRLVKHWSAYSEEPPTP